MEKMLVAKYGEEMAVQLIKNVSSWWMDIVKWEGRLMIILIGSIKNVQGNICSRFVARRICSQKLR